MGYRFLEHRSDIIVLASNSTFAKAMEDVAAGMFTQMGAERAKDKDSFALEVSAPTREELVVQFLTEIIAECETRPFTPKKMEITAFDESKMTIGAKIYGEMKVPENIIKAVTFHDLRAEKKGRNWEIQVLFDI